MPVFCFVLKMTAIFVRNMALVDSAVKQQVEKYL